MCNHSPRPITVSMEEIIPTMVKYSSFYFHFFANRNFTKGVFTNLVNGELQSLLLGFGITASPLLSRTAV